MRPGVCNSAEGATKIVEHTLICARAFTILLMAQITWLASGIMISAQS